MKITYTHVFQFQMNKFIFKRHFKDNLKTTLISKKALSEMKLNIYLSEYKVEYLVSSISS